MCVLYMSGLSWRRVVRQRRLEPGTEYLPKAFTPVQLRAKVRAVLDAPEL